MRIVIEGKEHRKGTSRKTGNDYDFYVLHFLAQQNGVEGKAAVNKIIDPSLIEFDSIKIGHEYELEPDLNGNIVRIEPVKS